MKKPTHYEKATQGIRVRVEPEFSLADSDPFEGHYVFSYDIAMENEGSEPARLLFRHWRIHDAAGEDTEVDGEGVIGEQPSLGPGDSHAYRSYCVLRSPAGYMEGHYTFVRPNGQEFLVEVPRFQLTAPIIPPPLVAPPPPDEDDEDYGRMN